MHMLTVFPIGNADTYLLSLEGGRRLLFDYAALGDPDADDDLRIDLPCTLREALGEAKVLDVVVFTHADGDHVTGAAAFFELTHAKKYQGGDRVGITELWVPAAFIVDTTFDNDDAPIIQAEARHRLREGSGIRVFGRPDALTDWLEREGLSLDSRRSCLVDAGTVVPGFTLNDDGAEFFAHSPFAIHQDAVIIDKNRNCIVLQAVLQVGGQRTRLILGADAPCEALEQIVQVTRAHGRDERLEWDVFKLPHHCSYLSLSDEKGADVTGPLPDIAWLYEERGSTGGILISSSLPIPSDDESTQPPHRQAAAYYRRRASALDGKFVVTMEHPSKMRPEPLVIAIDGSGAEVKQMRAASGVFLASRPAPRAG